MPPKCTHDENRRKVCASCGKKIVLGKKGIEFFAINSRYESLIKKFVKSDFDSSDRHFPISICITCKLTLNEHEKQICKRPLPQMPNYNDIVLPKPTRSTGELCKCYICLKATYNGHEKVVKGAGHKRIFSNKIDESNGLISSVFREQTNTDKVNIPKEKPNSNKICIICTNCLTTIGKGKRHNCCAESAGNNVTTFLQQLPEKKQEQIISKSLKRKSIEKGSETPEFTLSTKGPKLNVSLGKLKAPISPSFSCESLDTFRSTNGLSLNHMKKLASLLRCNVGKKSVPPRIMQHLSEKSKTLDTFYNEGRFEFDTGNDKQPAREMRPVVWANAANILDVVIERRNFIGNVLIKIMADGGQGFFKLSMTVLPDDHLDDNLSSDDDGEKLGPRKKKEKKLTSVHKLIILCIVPNVKETYDNMKLIFDLTKLNDIPFKFAADFKILLIVNGQQTASASFPCPYCFIPLQNLRSTSEKVNDNKEYLKNLKTFGDLRTEYEKFVSKGKHKKVAKECHSVVNAPLFNEDDDTCVLQKCIIPELHLLMGFVNHLFWNGLVPLLGRERALIWPKSLSIVSKNYHGEAFEGNACRKLLQNSDKLLDNEICGEVGSLKLVPFVSSFKTMDKIVNACFSSKTVNVAVDCEKLLKELKTSFTSTGVSETLKIHVILNHLVQCLNYLDKRGLGIWSEQSGEAIHSLFLKTYWNRYKINTMDDKRYLANLKKAVVEFSSQHL